jgi:DNA polymerase III delta subunit
MKSSRAPSKAGSPRSAAPRSRSGGDATLALLDAFDRGAFPSSLYVEGPSEPVRAALLSELRAAWAAAVPDAPVGRVFLASEASIEEILAAYQGASLFASRELAIVLEIEDIAKSEKKVAALAVGIARGAPQSCLVLVESSADGARKTLEPLRTACAVRWVAAPPSRAELMAWGARRLQRHGLAAEAGVLEKVTDACEGDPLAFFNEVDRLAAFGENGKVTAADAAKVMQPAVGADLPDFLSAVALGYPGLATQRLGRLLAAGVNEGTVMFALSNLVGGALGGWARERELSARMRQRMDPGDLARAMDAMYRAEAAWKQGKVDVVAALEQVTRALAGAH